MARLAVVSLLLLGTWLPTQAADGWNTTVTTTTTTEATTISTSRTRRLTTRRTTTTTTRGVPTTQECKAWSILALSGAGIDFRLGGWQYSRLSQTYMWPGGPVACHSACEANPDCYHFVYRCSDRTCHLHGDSGYEEDGDAQFGRDNNFVGDIYRETTTQTTTTTEEEVPEEPIEEPVEEPAEEPLIVP